MPMRSPRAVSVGGVGFLLLAVAIMALSGGAQGSSVAHPATPALPLYALAPLNVSTVSASVDPDGGAVPGSQFVGLAYSIQPPDSQISSLLKAEETPGSPEYQEFVTPSQYEEEFGPSSALIDGLQSYFESYGFQVTSAPGGEYHVFGTAGEVDSAFGTTIVYHRDGTSRYWAPTSVPTLPAPYASAVGSVLGLNTGGAPQYSPLQPILQMPIAPAPAATQPRPHLLTMTFVGQFYSIQGGTPIYVPPVGMNVSLDAVVTGGGPAPVAPCTWTWTFGDGTSATYTSATNCTNMTMHHEYVQAFNQFSTAEDINVTMLDSSGIGYGSYQAELFPSMSSTWMARYYSELQMVDHGLGGLGMTVGLDEMCDPGYTNGSATGLYSPNVAAFDAVMGLPAANIVYVGPGYPECAANWGFAGWSEETLLDMEWAHAMAPNATLEVYFGIDGGSMPWENYGDLDGGDTYWANNLPSGVWLASNSWGLQESTGYYALFHPTWAQAAAEGLSLFASSGDCGAADGNLAPTNPPANATPAVSFPSDDPDGVGVGGTILQTTREGVYVNEYVWNGTFSTNACSNNEGTGGGWSCIYTVPWFQANMPLYDTGFRWKTWQCSNFAPIWPPRGVPDVAADAATWADTYEYGDWLPIGGTSLASPMWAAMMAVSLDYNGLASRPVGDLNGFFYQIGTSNQTYERDFHDVVSGNNCNLAANCNSPFAATYLWDPATGWGGPSVWNLTHDMNSSGNLPGWYLVSGQVLNWSNDVPIAGATVFSGAAMTTTNVNGQWALYFPQGASTAYATYWPNPISRHLQGSVGFFVNTSALTGINIYLEWDLNITNSTTVVGKLVNQAANPLDLGVITIKTFTGVYVNTVATGDQGNFTAYLPPGIYWLTGNAPGYNQSASVEVVVRSLPVLAVVLVCDWPLHTVSGQVLSINSNLPIWGATVTATGTPDGAYETYKTTSSASGQFFIHLPQGTTTFTASSIGYVPGSVTETVYHNGLAGVLLLLTPTGARTSQVDLAVHVLDPTVSPSGEPVVSAGGHITLEVWANNSLSLQPQLGIYLTFVDAANGNWSSLNVSVGSGAPGGWGAGVAFVNYTAPFLGAATQDAVNVQVLTPGWSGSGSTQLYLLPYYPQCTSRCTFQVWGVVVGQNGARLVGAAVDITSPGGVPVQNVTTNNNGIYQVYLANGSYFAQPSLASYEPAGLTPFVVNGTPEEVDLALTGIPPPLSAEAQKVYNGPQTIFGADTWAVIPFIVLGMAVVAIAAWRILVEGRRTEEDSTPVFGAAAPEQQVFAGGEGGGPALPPGADAGAAGAPALSAPPPDTPWEITPAPPPPPPDTGPAGGGMDDGSGDAGDGSGGGSGDSGDSGDASSGSPAEPPTLP
jgi:hypothetical protein